MHSGEQAQAHYDQTLGELEDGFTGFDDPVTSEPPAPGAADERQAEARRVADALDAAAADVLGPG